MRSRSASCAPLSAASTSTYQGCGAGRGSWMSREWASTASRQVRETSSKDMAAAGIGGKIAADLAAAFGCERKRKQTSGFVCRALHGGEHASCLDRDGVVERVEAADPVHARERQHDFAARPGRHRAAD